VFVYRRIANVVLLFVFAVNVYRASTQSIVHDEAFAWDLFVSAPWPHLFDTYHTCHHILHTVLCKMSVQLLGLSEFSLRIPSLLGGLLCLIMILRLSRHAFGEGRQFLLAVLLLSLNPLVLDHMSIARGYGLAIGFFLWALDQMLLFMGGDRKVARIWKAALGLGLSVATNLTLLVPGAALAFLFLLLLARDGWTAEAMDSFVVPGIVTCFVIVVLPLTKARLGQFDFGMPTLGESLRDLVAMSLYHHPLDGRMYAILPAPGFWFAMFAYVLVPVVLGGAAAGCLPVLYHRTRSGNPAAVGQASWLLLLSGGCLLLSIGSLISMHSALRVPYPAARMGLYLIPLVTLTALALPASLNMGRAARLLVGVPLWITGVACLAHYLVHFQVTHYGGFRYDASTKRIIGLIRDQQAQWPLARVRVGTSWQLAPSMNFYRRMYGLEWMERLDRRGADGEFDYYILHAEDARLIKNRSLRVLYSNRLADVYLAAPGSGPEVRK
jgi:hypothetical protein